MKAELNDNKSSIKIYRSKMTMQETEIKLKNEMIDELSNKY